MKEIKVWKTIHGKLFEDKEAAKESENKIEIRHKLKQHFTRMEIIGNFNQTLSHFLKDNRKILQEILKMIEETKD